MLLTGVGLEIIELRGLIACGFSGAFVGISKAIRAGRTRQFPPTLADGEPSATLGRHDILPGGCRFTLPDGKLRHRVHGSSI